MSRLCVFRGGHSLGYIDLRNHKNLAGCPASKAFKRTILKSTMFAAFAVITLAPFAAAAELPEAPSSAFREASPMISVSAPAPASFPKMAEVKPVDAKFVALAIISTGSTFADSYTTLFARQNWMAGKTGVCNAEVSSAYLYGTHPTVGRTYAVASVKSAGSILASYYLRKHHNRFWSMPLVANSVASLGGVTQNMMVCN
jgi:hypothetical protein